MLITAALLFPVISWPTKVLQGTKARPVMKFVWASTCFTFCKHINLWIRKKTTVKGMSTSTWRLCDLKISTKPDFEPVATNFPHGLVARLLKRYTQATLFISVKLVVFHIWSKLGSLDSDVRFAIVKSLVRGLFSLSSLTENLNCDRII